MSKKSDIQFGRCKCGNTILKDIKEGDKCIECGATFTHDYERCLAKEKTAKKMFEELGYEYQVIPDNDNNTKIFAIVIIGEYKDYYVSTLERNVTSFNKLPFFDIEENGISVSESTEEHMAIHQQLKELGWIE